MIDNNTNVKSNVSHTDDDTIRCLLRTAKKRAPEHLKYRIMHQITTENELIRKPATRQAFRQWDSSVMRNFTETFGLMYGVLGTIAGAAFVVKGKAFLMSVEFVGLTALVTSIFAFFWLLTQWEIHRQNKRKRKWSRGEAS